MFSLSTRRSAVARSKHLSSTTTLLNRTTTPPPAQSLLAYRDFHASRRNAAFSPTWMPKRVKTPWIDALTQSREAAQQKHGDAPAAAVQPDLTPRRMADSHFKAVRIISWQIAQFCGRESSHTMTRS
ncbi:uncharacterized protein BP01DRAFT_217137 [Aspergillus saccharolyticus JOP 1030-1]|uniref:Uncharacterized protein n=1 Tax=Aspergillus saccharolyticus JOP 1030-1 TaxID=1450539 RepID=A0A318ZU21_9EURO|nr:hypothetical protein BP01DRAFT_217137 [Aspergillus saccharolyticus JOP 1030-1]PYH47490.1 hypothetical protein BP01DRAFT_217137 [Aspergillus saccharolyticus JOP 1030-1]